MKEHKKLYKSGKLWMTATVLALAAGTAMTTTTAHADTTTPTVNATAADGQTADQQKEALQQDIKNKQQQLDEKTNQAANQQSELDSYKGQVTSENTNYQNEQDQIKKDAANKATSVNEQINNTQSQLNNAQNDVANTQTQISNTQTQITNLQNDHGTTETDTNVVSVPNGKLDKSQSLLENTARNNLWDNYYSDEQPTSDWNKNIIPNNIYVSPDNNKTEDHSATAPTDFGNEYLPYQNDIDQVNESTGMTESQMRELSILLLNEINHARAQRGLAPFVMTEAQFQRAMARARQNSAANLDHDANDMNSALGSDWHSENLAMVDADGGTNMLSLLYSANNSVSSMLITDADSNWGHRNNFLDDGNYNAAFGFRLLDNGYYVMTFDTTYATDADRANDLVSNTINNYAAEGPVKGSTTTPVDHTAEINNLKSHLADLNNQLATQQAAVTRLQNQLNDLNGQKAQISHDEQSQLADSTAKHNQKIADLNSQISAHEANLAQLHNDIQNLQTAIANDQTALDNLNKGGQTPVEVKKDNEKYTDLEADLVNQVTINQGDYTADTLPAPSLSDDAFIEGNESAAAAFMILARSVSHLYPAGTTVAWADPAQVIADAKIPGDHDEYLVLHFPDGTTSARFLKHNALHVNAKSTPTTPTEETHTLTINYVLANGTSVGSQSFSGHNGDAIAASRTQIPAGYDLVGNANWNNNLVIGTTDSTITVTVAKHDDHTTTPTDQGHETQPSTPTAPVDHGHETRPSTPLTPNNNNGHNAVAQLPTGAKIVNGQVVDAQGNVLPEWSVVNGQVVKNSDQVMTREAYRAQQANVKKLPQTGNGDETALVGLGIASLLSMFGLAGTKKERN